MSSKVSEIEPYLCYAWVASPPVWHKCHACRDFVSCISRVCHACVALVPSRNFVKNGATFAGEPSLVLILEHI